MSTDLIFTETAERLAELGAENMTPRQLTARRGIVRRVRQSRTSYEPCTRCGGRGGAEHWPGWECYRCGNRNPMRHEAVVTYFYAPEHALEADLDAALSELIEQRKWEAEVAKRDAKAGEAERILQLRISQDHEDALEMDSVLTRLGRCGRTPSHVGEVGGKVELEATVTFTKVLDGRYGTKMMVAFETTGADRLVTFGTGDSLWDLRKGDSVKLTGKIKEHGEREGVPQTILTHVKTEEN